MMNDKTKNKDIDADKDSPQEETVLSDYEVEEQVFLRQHYDNTSMFEMDIEKAKEVATTRSRVLESNVSGIAPSSALNEIHEQETNAIKRSLAELRELEQQQESADIGGNSGAGLFGKLKGLFSNKD